MNKKENKHVFCVFCGGKIHIDHMGGVFKQDDETKYFCDNLPCLLDFESFQFNKKK